MCKIGTTRDVLGRECEKPHTAQYGYRCGYILHVILVPKPLMIRNESIHNPAMLLKKLYSIVPLLGEKYEMLCGLSNL